ncbi:MAG TPA: hypothetical protein VN947_31805 [Polyangia bacterium]|nr:hypothetical protein [Polyangia bacterium]
MRTMVAIALVTLGLSAGCATFNRSTGVSGGPATSGAEKSQAALSGSNYDNIATSGSNPDDPTAGLPAPR